MKRSEMIDTMVHYWCQMENEAFLEDRMGWLLEVIEEFGMSPPVWCNEYRDFEEWEPEDENTWENEED